MALVRILVDGYNLIAHIQEQANFRYYQRMGLLHNWPELAAGTPRHSETAREALVEMLTQYQDACGTPVTIFFDGTGARRGKPKNQAAGAVEIVFSSGGQTADDLIERATVSGFGGSVASCGNFIRMINGRLSDLLDDLNKHNRAARNSFRRAP